MAHQNSRPQNKSDLSSMALLCVKSESPVSKGLRMDCWKGSFLQQARRFRGELCSLTLDNINARGCSLSWAAPSPRRAAPIPADSKKLTCRGYTLGDASGDVSTSSGCRCRGCQSRFRDQQSHASSSGAQLGAARSIKVLTDLNSLSLLFSLNCVKWR